MIERVAVNDLPCSMFVLNNLHISIDDHDGRDFKGSVCHNYFHFLQRFSCVSEFLYIIERMLDEVNYPMQSMEHRKFMSIPGSADREADLMQNDDIKQTQENKGKKATFVVQIQYRQNATWQGKVKWVEKDEEVMFRSALELIKMIDAATADIDDNNS